MQKDGLALEESRSKYCMDVIEMVGRRTRSINVCGIYDYS